MQTRALKTLTKIAQISSFIAAARELNMTLSAVSMQMKALEADLNVKLFDRSFRPPKLTPVGRAVVKISHEMLESESSIKQLCSDGDDLTGIYRIGFIGTCSVRMLPEFLKRSSVNTPRARFLFETGLSDVLESKVLSGELDYAVVTGSRMPDPGLVYRKLKDDGFTFVLPAEFKRQDPAAIWERLQFLHFRPNHGIGKIIARYMNPLKSPKSRPTIYFDGVEPIVECAKLGLGFALLPELDAKRYADERVCFLPVDLAREISLVGVNEAHSEKVLDLLEPLLCAKQAVDAQT